MKLFDALHEMRRLSAEVKSFAFSFMSFDATRKKSDGIVYVRHGRLRKRESAKYNKNAEIMEAYTDLDTTEPRQFYQPLLMTFNGEKVDLR